MATSGCKKIAFIGQNIESSAGQALLNAYTNALSTADIEYNPSLIYEVTTADSLEPNKLFSRIIADGCDGLFATNTSLTITLADCLIMYNVSTNIHIPMLGYDTGQTTASALTTDTIAHSSEQFAQLAYQQLIYSIAHPDSMQKERVLQLKGTLHMHKYNPFSQSDNS